MFSEPAAYRTKSLHGRLCRNWIRGPVNMHEDGRVPRGLPEAARTPTRAEALFILHLKAMRTTTTTNY
eukprot:3903402-Heterocapsa_arctica.AAC.1